jgi:hypothetical protein
MRGRVRWTHATIALAMIAAVTIAAPAIGGPSLKKLVKKEVAKQIGKATGPPGPAGPVGPPGTNGVDGIDGTARAYATVTPHGTAGTCTRGPTGTGCTFSRSKGVSTVTREFQGIYCVTAPGIRSDTTSAAVTVEAGNTIGPGQASATIAYGTPSCSPDAFEVFTYLQNTVPVRNYTDNGIEYVAGPAFFSDYVAFTIVIP